MNPVAKVQAERFANIAPIDGHAAHAAESLAAHAEAIEADAGTEIFRENSPCPSIAFLTSGRVRVYKSSPTGREVTLYRVHPGEACILTTCCVLRDAAFPANAVVDQPITALAVNAARFREWFEREPVWRSFVVNLFSDRLEHVLSLVDAIAFQRTDARLARFIITHADISRGVAELTHDSAAREIGTAREVVSRILERFADQGLIQTERGRVRLLDPDALAEIANTA